MASLEKRGDRFRIVFRYGGQKLTRSLKTTRESVAQAALARLEDNLGRAELGTLEVPEDADVLTFLFSDGKTVERPKLAPLRSLAKFLDAYLANFPEGSVEPTTFSCMRVYVAHLNRILGKSTALPTIRRDQLQHYVSKRQTEPGLYGRLVGPPPLRRSCRRCGQPGIGDLNRTSSSRC